jgi:serine protease Do
MEKKQIANALKVSALAAAVTLAFAGGYSYSQHGKSPVSEAVAASAAAAAPDAPRAPGVALPDFADIAARHGPAVVNISVSGSVKTAFNGLSRGLPKMEPDDPFFDFFRRFQGPNVREIPKRGQGSGFILSSDGIVLTNAHVVADADEVTVKLTDRREFKAKVIGVDKPTDIAVLRIDAKNLPTVKVGDPQRARVGEWVVAIGSPFGFENSVTAGIISAKSRSLPDEGYVPFLQTDVAINPGNSGGPLFNLNGEVIGINSQIYSQSGGYQGLSFSIPIDVAMKVEKQLVENGKVSRGRLGVLIQNVDQSLAESFGLDKATGALVGSVEKGSPADKAGIEAGDVILKFNGKDIARSSDLPPLVADVTPGSKAEIEIWRKNKSRTLTVSVGETKVAKADQREAPAAKGKLGLSVRPLTNDEKKEAEVADGLIVEDVADGPAAKAGIRPGDVILSVNGEKVASVEQLRALVDKKDKRVALQILRDDQKMFVPIQIG